MSKTLDLARRLPAPVRKYGNKVLMRRFRRTYRELSSVLGARAAVALLARTTIPLRSLVVLSWPGLDHDVLVRRGTADIRSFTEVFVRRIYEWPDGFRPTSSEFRTIIDAGANVGFSVLWFAARSPGARIVALEADRENFNMLQRNTAHLTNVDCHHRALWNEVTTLDLTPGDTDSIQVGHADSDKPAAKSSGKVDAVDMMTLMNELGVDRVDLLKIDIEGAEYEVFSDSAPWIDRIDTIAGELHGRFRPGVSAVVDQALRGFAHRVDRRDDVEFFVSR